MKVRNVNSLETGQPGPRSVGHIHGEDVKAMAFQRTLTGLSAEAHTAHVMTMADEINRQGEKLGKRADVKELERYRALIKRFLDEVISNGYAFSKENSFAPRGGHRLFAMVKTINQKLDELGREVMAQQADNLKVLAMVDEIRGLILDLLL